MLKTFDSTLDHLLVHVFMWQPYTEHTECARDSMGCKTRCALPLVELRVIRSSHHKRELKAAASRSPPSLHADPGSHTGPTGYPSQRVPPSSVMGKSVSVSPDSGCGPCVLPVVPI